MPDGRGKYASTAAFWEGRSCLFTACTIARSVSVPGAADGHQSRLWLVRPSAFVLPVVRTGVREIGRFTRLLATAPAMSGVAESGRREDAPLPSDPASAPIGASASGSQVETCETGGLLGFHPNQKVHDSRDARTVIVRSHHARYAEEFDGGVRCGGTTL